MAYIFKKKSMPEFGHADNKGLRETRRPLIITLAFLKADGIRLIEVR